MWDTLAQRLLGIAQEGFVEHVSSNESSVVATFTFSVGSGDDVESTCRVNSPSDFFKENSLPFKDALETENFIRGKVDLVKEQDVPRSSASMTEAIVPDGVAINKAETANKIVFIGFDSNVYTDEFSSELGTCLLDRKRFTIARETRDKRRVE